MELSDILKFEKFLSVMLIKILYWVVGVIIVIGTLKGVLNGESPFSGFMSYGYSSSWSITGAVLSLLLGVIGLVIWRVVCEGLIIVFSINDRLGALVELKRNEMGK